MLKVQLHAAAVPPAGPPLAAPDRRADVHRLGARAGHRPVQGRHRRLVPGPQCAAERAARGVDRADQDGAGRLQPRASRRARRAVRRQPDRARLQRSAGARRRRVREAPGADHDHQPARAAGGGGGRAFLWRHRAARRHQRAPRPQGGRGRRRRIDPGVRRGRRSCRHAQPVRAAGRGAQLVQGHHRPVRCDRQRLGGAGRAGHGRRSRLRRHALHRHARGQRQARVQADADRHQRRRHRLQLAVLGRARQLSEAQRGGGRLRSGQPADRRQIQDELRLERQGLARHLERGPGCGQHHRHPHRRRLRGPPARGIRRGGDRSHADRALAVWLSEVRRAGNLSYRRDL